jgi:hypothetical protein
VGVPEPAALVEGALEHLAQSGRRVLDDLLGVREALGVGAEGLDGRVDLLGGVLRALGHAAGG